jgi:hypothetical protein
MGRQLMKSSDEGSASESNSDNSCEAVVPILKQSARKYCSMKARIVEPQ